MIIGIGTDIVEVSRILAESHRGVSGAITSLFTPSEIGYCESKRYPERHFAARLAAKEAFFKALGSGVTNLAEWLMVEVSNDESGKPELKVSGHLVERLRDVRILASMSHTKRYGTAVVVLEN